MRGAFAGVPRGQLEAARAFGMSRWKIFRRIWLPQAVARALPTLGGETVLQLKATPLVATITMIDIYSVASRVQRKRSSSTSRCCCWRSSTWCIAGILVLDLPQAGSRAFRRGWARSVGMDTVTLTLAEATALCERAAIAAGASPEVALSIARSAVARRSRRPAERRARAFHRLSRGARSRPHRRQGRRRDHPAGAGDHPFRCQGRGRASRLRRRIRADRRGGKRIRAGAVHAEERLHLRRPRLFRRPARRQRAGGDRRHQRPGPARRFRLDQAGLLHQPDGVRRAGGRRPAAGHRPVVERDGLRQHPRRGEGRQADPRGLGARCRGPADHRCAARP